MSSYKEVLQRFSEQLRAERAHESPLPRRKELEDFTAELVGLFFPELAPAPFVAPSAFSAEAERLGAILARFIEQFASHGPAEAQSTAERFFATAPQVYELLRKDAQAIYDGDPAAKSIREVIVAYPGFLATAVFRFAHALHLLNVPILPRAMTEYVHRLTGIDIHPGARIGESFCIDHGTGIVIGETSEIGHHVKLYQGVTLGGVSIQKTLAGRKRHPTLGNHVVVYANATILGGETRIGDNCTIGGNVWLTESVPDNSTVYHKSEISIRAAT